MTDQKRTLEDQGFVKHDGSGIPDCYKPDDLVDYVYTGSDGSTEALTRRAGSLAKWSKRQFSGNYWTGEFYKDGVVKKTHGRLTHHRHHISEREQLDIAIDELHETAEFYRSHERSALTEHKRGWADRAEQTEAILKTLRERQPS